MFQGDRVILKGRVEVGLGGVTGVARFGEKRKIRQLQARHHPGNSSERGEVGLPPQMGMDEHQADEQGADTCQSQGQARFSEKKSSPALFISKGSANQGS
jgi:hypothetical protein